MVQIETKNEKPFNINLKGDYNKDFHASDSLAYHAQQDIHQSTKQLGISTFQLDHDHEHSLRQVALSKRATNLSGLSHHNSSAAKLTKPKSLVARLPVPYTDRKKATHFKISSTMNLSELSPLI